MTTQPEPDRGAPNLPREVCRGAMIQMLFEGRTASESQIEALLDRYARRER